MIKVSNQSCGKKRNTEVICMIITNDAKQDKQSNVTDQPYVNLTAV